MTSIDCVVAPLDQSHEVPSLAVSVTDSPAQNVVSSDAVMEAAGRSCTVTVVGDDVDAQPFALVTVTL